MKTKKIALLVSLFLVFSLTTIGQKPYDPSLNGKEEIAKAVSKAKKEGKHVLLQIGGNWCPWCIKMHNYLHSETTLNKLLEDNYIFLEVNYSKENKNFRCTSRTWLSSALWISCYDRFKWRRKKTSYTKHG